MNTSENGTVDTKDQGQQQPILSSTGIREIVFVTIRPIIQLVILLLAAGRWDWVNAWIYFILVFTLFATYAIVFAARFPELLNQRGKVFREDTKRFDKVFYACLIPLVITVMIVSGLDGGRYQWTTPPTEFSVAAAILLVLSLVLFFWAMAVNTHFEMTVRIQSDRGHTVCTPGPYRFVRHPGYAGGVVIFLTVPILLGSYWGLVPAGAVVLLVIWRTAMEDRTLQSELTGYKDYAATTRYRLIPYLW